MTDKEFHLLPRQLQICLRDGNLNPQVKHRFLCCSERFHGCGNCCGGFSCLRLALVLPGYRCLDRSFRRRQRVGTGGFDCVSFINEFSQSDKLPCEGIADLPNNQGVKSSPFLNGFEDLGNHRHDGSVDVIQPAILHHLCYRSLDRRFGLERPFFQRFKVIRHEFLQGCHFPCSLLKLYLSVDLRLLRCLLSGLGRLYLVGGLRQSCLLLRGLIHQLSKTLVGLRTHGNALGLFLRKAVHFLLRLYNVLFHCLLNSIERLANHIDDLRLEHVPLCLRDAQRVREGSEHFDNRG